MWLIVGLGNPGPEYVFTRHNLGFQVVDELSRVWGIPLSRKNLDAYWGQGRVGGETIILAQPQTYMNLSGRAVSRLLTYFRLTPEALLVIHDDLDVPLGRLKIVDRGGPGGHRGVASIMSTLDTEEFLRVKLGLGRPPEMMPAEAFVLSRITREREEVFANLLDRATQAVIAIIESGVAAARTRFHGEPE